MWAFQKANGLPRTGVVDAATQATFRTARRPRPRSHSGYVIEIDKTPPDPDGRRERVRELGVQHVDRFRPPVHADGARYIAHTPEGMFTVIRQVDGADNGPLGTLWRPKYFTWHGIAVHGYTERAAVPRVARLRAGVERRRWTGSGRTTSCRSAPTVWVYVNEPRATGRRSSERRRLGRDGVIVAVHVQPRPGRTRVAGRHGDALRIRVAAPPVDGRATDAARVALADAFGTRRAR